MSLNDGTDKYFVGSHLIDNVVGENNVYNAYEFVGLNTVGQTLQAPTDHFTGGTNGFNEAVFADARVHYSIITSSGTTTITNIDDPQYAGSLITTNVQALAFAPTHDPAPSNGALEATGDTLVILQSLSNAASIDAGATLEIFAANSAEPVTFNATTGTLRLDQSVSYSGTISGFSTQDGTLAGSDQIDLRDINWATAHITGYIPTAC